MSSSVGKVQDAITQSPCWLIVFNLSFVLQYLQVASSTSAAAKAPQQSLPDGMLGGAAPDLTMPEATPASPFKFPGFATTPAANATAPFTPSATSGDSAKPGERAGHSRAAAPSSNRRAAAFSSGARASARSSRQTTSQQKSAASLQRNRSAAAASSSSTEASNQDSPAVGPAAGLQLPNTASAGQSAPAVSRGASPPGNPAGLFGFFTPQGAPSFGAPDCAASADAHSAATKSFFDAEPQRFFNSPIVGTEAAAEPAAGDVGGSVPAGIHIGPAFVPQAAPASEPAPFTAHFAPQAMPANGTFSPQAPPTFGAAQAGAFPLFEAAPAMAPAGPTLPQTPPWQPAAPAEPVGPPLDPAAEEEAFLRRLTATDAVVHINRKFNMAEAKLQQENSVLRGQLNEALSHGAILENRLGWLEGVLGVTSPFVMTLITDIMEACGFPW